MATATKPRARKAAAKATKPPKFELGTRLMDTATEAVGIAIARVEELAGAGTVTMYLLEMSSFLGGSRRWVPEGRLRVAPAAAGPEIPKVAAQPRKPPANGKTPAKRKPIKGGSATPAFVESLVRRKQAKGASKKEVDAYRKELLERHGLA